MTKNTATAPQKRTSRLVSSVLVLGFFLLSLFLCARTFLIPHYMRESAHLFEHGEYTAARSLYKKILLLDPRNAYAWDWLVYTYANEGRYHEARAIAQKALQAIPDDISVHITVGDVYMKEAKYDEAKEFFSFVRVNKDRALREEYLYMWPAYKTGMRKLATAHEKSGDSEKARMILEELVEVYPDDEVLREQLLQVAKKEGTV